MLGKYLPIRWFLIFIIIIVWHWISKNIITCLDDLIIIYGGY
jgi:hypothetical protein